MRGASALLIACLLAGTAHLAGADGGELVLLPPSRLTTGSASSHLPLPWGGMLNLQEILSPCRRVPLADGAIAVVDPARGRCGDYERDRNPFLPVMGDLVLSPDGTFLNLTVGDCLQRGDIVYFRRAQRLAFCVAPFSSVRTFTLVTHRSGSGSGTVASTPSGIDCGSICSAQFDEGSNVSLAAAAASGSVFTGWSGDCAGTGSCQLSMTADRSATATFEPECATLIVQSIRVSGTESYEACGTVTVGPEVTVLESGHLLVRSGSAVILLNGVAVRSGGALTVGIDSSLLR
jgi:hypothetical protein